MRQMSRRALPAVAAATALLLGLGACGSDDSHGSMAGGDTRSTPGTAGSVTGAQGDVEFAQMMIPHHEQAVEMATLALENGTASEDVKALAQQIQGAQDPEIRTMKGWLGQWGADESAGPMDHGSGGMMSDDDMSSLADASGDEFDRMWLSMMIEHHQGAVDMAQDVLDTTANPDVKQLATAVVEGQQKEIATMEDLLG